MPAHPKIWTSQEDEKLLKLIKEGANRYQLESGLGVSIPLIRKRLVELGYESLKDARKRMDSNHQRRAK